MATRWEQTPFPLNREPPIGFGGADRDRTDDPLLAKQVLSQLSYSPVRSGFGGMLNGKC